MSAGVIIVSNRLPVSARKVDGKLEFYPSAGGLATGLSGYTKDKKNRWIGWPGLANEDLSEADRQAITAELAKHNCFPVFLSRKQLDDYYNGFSNSVLWPAFHELSYNAEVPDACWNAYKRVNQLFADAVLALSGSNSTVWVHDYQLLLLPSLLRVERPDGKLGFFLHIPFPTPEKFAEVPHARRLLTGLLGADLIGLHTPSYVDNFLRYCQDCEAGLIGHHKLLLPDRVVRVTDFPMGIDYGKFSRAVRSRAVKRELLRLKTKYGRKRLILTVDRLDPTKGLVERLEAYRQLLSQSKSLRGKVVMVMLAVPSRTEIAEYQRLKRRLEKLVRAVNKEFGTLRWQPVDYQYRSLPFEALAALYTRADVAFIAPIKDGMNLVAKEYLASKPDRSGVLVLSETAGAAEELKDAILVDPSDTGSLVRGLRQALRLPRPELRKRAGKMQRHLSEFTVHKWAGNFMKTLQQPMTGTRPRVRSLNNAVLRQAATDFRAAARPLLLLDYDGVLAPFRSNPEDAKPSRKLINLLAKLSDHANLVLISGRSPDDLKDWFGRLDKVTLIAEHGAFIRKSRGKRWQPMPGIDLSWMEEVRTILDKYSAMTPGAFVESKQASLVWHYRRASSYYAHKHLVIIKRLLKSLARRYDITVDQGNMILEVRSTAVHKGSAALAQLTSRTDFVLAVGDDTTDEDMFEHLPEWAYTIKVGRGRTYARYRAKNVDEVQNLLKRLIKTI